LSQRLFLPRAAPEQKQDQQDQKSVFICHEYLRFIASIMGVPSGYGKFH